MPTDPLAAYRPNKVETPWGLKLDANDAFAKVEVVQAEIAAMGVAAEVAEFAAQAFVWSGGHLPCENLLQTQANGALARWQAAKMRKAAAVAARPSTTCSWTAPKRCSHRTLGPTERVQRRPPKRCSLVTKRCSLVPKGRTLGCTPTV